MVLFRCALFRHYPSPSYAYYTRTALDGRSRQSVHLSFSSTHYGASSRDAAKSYACGCPSSRRSRYVLCTSLFIPCNSFFLVIAILAYINCQLHFILFSSRPLVDSFSSTCPVMRPNDFDAAAARFRKRPEKNYVLFRITTLPRHY